VAKIPGVDSVVTGVLSVLQAQTEALAALPGAVQSLSAAVKNLADATAGAKETVATMNRLATRMDGIITELEEPLKGLAPGMRTLAAILEDPVVATVPETLAQVQRDILPVLRTLADTNERVAFIAGSTERLMTFVDDTGRTLAGLPGAALLGRRRPGSVTAPPVGKDPD
jgi:ABC-type transporter Mla subunit MlaD